jgi:glycosyltransferase involved in cell wall biosynthesis
MVAEALAALGSVDVCVVNPIRSPELDAGHRPQGFDEVDWWRVEESKVVGLRAAIARTSPVAQARLAADGDDALRARTKARRYDLAWCFEPRGFEPIAHLAPRPVVLDLQNVFSTALAHRRRLWIRQPRQLARLHRSGRDLVDQPGMIRRWRQWEMRAVRRCDRIVVCSELDRQRFGAAASVVPNCYRRPDRPAGRNHSPLGPVRIGFVGLLHYEPNLDAARWFADRVLPLVRALEPDAELRLIGEYGSGLTAMAARPGVRLLGFVPDLDAELAQISVLVAPIRFGGGTRIKILEAFAHEIPMVSTAVGAEGIDASDGQHLLIRNDPAGFARAVVDVHRNRELRRRLVTSAARRYRDRYTWERGVDSVQEVVAAVIAERGAASVI